MHWGWLDSPFTDACFGVSVRMGLPRERLSKDLHLKGLWFVRAWRQRAIPSRRRLGADGHGFVFETASCVLGRYHLGVSRWERSPEGVRKAVWRHRAK